jgi:hypothetical protein
MWRTGGDIMPRKITPMKFHGFYCPDELWKAMQDAATSLNESDSEYIRKAVEMRNAQHNTFPVFPKDKEVAEALFNGEHPPLPTGFSPIMQGKVETVKDVEKAVAKLKAKKAKKVQTFMKGEKK